MKSLLTQLERNEMLLMYLAGELPLQDQQQVQRMLEQDEGLRVEMQKLQAMLQGVEGAMVGGAGGEGGAGGGRHFGRAGDSADESGDAIASCTDAS